MKRIKEISAISKKKFSLSDLPSFQMARTYRMSFFEIYSKKPDEEETSGSSFCYFFCECKKSTYFSEVIITNSPLKSSIN